MMRSSLDSTPPAVECSPPARVEADYDVHDLLPAALDELGLAFYPVGSEAGQEAAARTLARRMLAGELTPWEFTFRFVSHGHELPLTERLAASTTSSDTTTEPWTRSMPR
ncbi:hypothetical protein [Streptomyces sp. NPDC059371]|uniref:hypothetical protein n=1 Tax=Streptomyces sp. NPDC059371 TaxID=3346812 RepID=UPI0036B7854A